ncbi:hypothetical protein [Hymenobacter negativus]|uniref:DUF4840 domain-containing protein n=1 Tax=Hymenobacter negativus TaxID=2795026 RepID=A0ABS3QED2_9BACT|nr:hypothetical protein [Hymenobacter negativus]MBO2009605.1 hypothetical protein [Hymenobacter negativus]
MVAHPSFNLVVQGISLLIGTALATGCSAPLDPTQYRAYLANPAHGFTQTQEANGISVTCTYRPTDLLVSQELAQNANSTTSAQLDSVRRSYAGKTCFALALAKDSTAIENQFATNPTAFTQTLTYLSNGIAADVFLVTSPRDSVPALVSMYPRQYGNTPRSTVLLIFDTHQLNLEQGFHLTFRSTAFNLGTLRFPFPAATLADLPALKFN